ncbi:hypothetical protein ACN47E_001545 [Coniothyrium glycines]
MQHTSSMFPCILLLLAGLSATAAQSSSNRTHLVAPALVTDATNNTIFQCWRLGNPFITSSVPGVSGTQVVTISNNTNLGYTVLPPRYDGGIHTAPVAQLVHFISGAAHITLPFNDTASLWLMGGKGGLLFAVDTTGSGHITRYPSDQETLAITAPFANGLVPDHEVVADGPCLGQQTFA